MRFKCKQIPVRNPIVSLGGRKTRPWHMVFISVTGPAATKPLFARVDPGSDETLFDVTVARDIGIDLSNAPSTKFGGIVHGGYSARFAQVTFRLTDGMEFREWTGWVGFVSGLRPPVLGFGGCLQYFDAKFFGADESFELEVNWLYPGT